MGRQRLRPLHLPHPPICANCGVLSIVCIISFLFGWLINIPQARVSTTHHIHMQYDEFWRQDTVADFNSWTLNGVEVSGTDHQPSLELAPSSLPLHCSPVDIDGGIASYDASTGLCMGTDPYPPGGYDKDLNYYNGGNFYFGAAVSPVHTTSQAITTVIASWNATTPAGTWMEVHVRVLQGEHWSHWYKLPIWANDFSTIHRHSVNKQTDSSGTVATDTLLHQGRASNGLPVETHALQPVSCCQSCYSAHCGYCLG